MTTLQIRSRAIATLEAEVAALAAALKQAHSLLREIRGELVRDAAIWEAELVNKIDELVGEEADGNL